MTQDLFDEEITVKRRPTFLKVLCILTFIGSGYGIINSAVTYFKADTISEMVTEAKTEIKEDMNQQKKKDDESAFVSQMMGNMSKMSTPENLRKSAIGNFITSLLCLAGAILMWNLRRTGFYIYTLGTIISIIIPFYLFGSNFLTNISAGFLGFIGVLFVIFYAMNLKSMK
jgi:hypothetical protein